MKLSNAHSCICFDTTGFLRVCFMTSYNHCLMMHGGTLLFYYTDSISHLLAADTVTRVFASMEMAIG